MNWRKCTGGVAAALGMLVVLGALGLGLRDKTESEDTTVTVFLVRHAEKVSEEIAFNSQDPDLSEEGIARADRLTTILKDQTIHAVFITKTIRSFQTGMPTADMNGVELTEYPPTDTNWLVKTIDATPGDGSVLIVAHSNTVPMILKALGGRDMPELDESEYDRFIAVVRNNGEHIKTIELRF